MKPDIHHLMILTAAYVCAVSCSSYDPSVMSDHIGVCTSIDNATAARDAGCAYIEVSVASFLIPESPWEDFAPRLEKAKASPLPVLRANGFFPSDIALVGPDADTARTMAYVREAFKRAEAVGIKAIVLGSGRSRNIPEGFSRETAEAQFTALCRSIGPVAREHGITVVLEPLRPQETNFINSVREGTDIARKADDPNICVLADFYHMAQVGEDPEAIIEAGDLLRHCHIAENARRTAPGTDGDDFTPYFKALEAISYTGCISMECGWDDFGGQIAKAVAEIKAQISSSGRPSV